MIRERVSTQGVIRPLEPEDKLSALSLPPHLIGIVSELAARRYLDGRDKFARKFAHQYRSIEKERARNIHRAQKEAQHTLEQLQQALFADDESSEAKAGSKRAKGKARAKSIAEGIRQGSASSWAWALDEERPPPSSIAARRDTTEARTLAHVADRAVDGAVSGNTLWSFITTFLTAGPGNVSDSSTRDAKEEIEKLRDNAERKEREEDRGGRGRKSTLSATVAKLFDRPRRAKSSMR
jgi:hypothetical protein